MRLLHTAEFKLTKFSGATPEYAIVSHRWSENKEIVFTDFTKDGTLTTNFTKEQLQDPRTVDFGEEVGISKIAHACLLAREANPGLDFDANARISGAYAGGGEPVTVFGRSQWFKRGWTLQELLAPRELRFFDHEWTDIGTRSSLASDIEKAAHIAPRYLQSEQASRAASIATKMSWASDRTTTVDDDMAYCMLGIFGVSMDVRYGEGQDAFLRLEQELVKNSMDESIFAWKFPEPDNSESCGLLAPWPSCFRESADFTNQNTKKYKERVSYQWTKGGIEFYIPDRLPGRNDGSLSYNAIRSRMRQQYQLAWNCWSTGREGQSEDTVAISLEKKDGMWRRVRCNELAFVASVRSSKSIYTSSLKASPIHVPQRMDGEREWRPL